MAVPLSQVLVVAALATAMAAPAFGDLSGHTLVEEVRSLVRDHYIVVETGEAVDAALAAGLTHGGYDVRNADELVQRINEDLQAASHDPHLMLMFDPEGVMAGMQGDQIRNGPVFEAKARRGNHGITELRVLDGNIRYMKLDGFTWVGTPSAAALDIAMAFMRDGDAAVIDIRQNMGGSPEAVRYLTSHFMEGGRLLVTFHMSSTGSTTRSISHEHLPGRMIGMPLFVLTSHNTASAAEEFAAHVTGFGLGELIGETTMGAAFRNTLFPVAGRYVLSVSVGRPELASTGGHWEGKGIQPSTEVPAQTALDVALERARLTLAATNASR